MPFSYGLRRLLPSTETPTGKTMPGFNLSTACSRGLPIRTRGLSAEVASPLQNPACPGALRALLWPFAAEVSAQECPSLVAAGSSAPSPC